MSDFVTYETLKETYPGLPQRHYLQHLSRRGTFPGYVRASRSAPPMWSRPQVAEFFASQQSGTCR